MEMLMARPKLFINPNWDDVPSVMGTQQVADLLQVHINTVKKLITTGKLAAFRVGRVYRVNKVDLLEYIKGSHNEATG